MTIRQHIEAVKAYCRDHLGIKLDEFWLSQEDTDRLISQVNGIPMVKCKALEGNTDIIIGGLVIKTIGKHDRHCRHLTKSHFQDVGEVYCHDCRTIIGEQIPTATHRRSSNVGPQS